ncbi:chemotaxis response regulator protein-glutamate methylesterase [Sphingomonas sp. AP4-R1]|uniref:protein-glutamate methylesterase/protein-glutamine glutaminase n=1 Tax=Sphingomonas sp. AP4-R1 TaxID=2735134 RepID=UPI0014934C33|nr:chemotaxis response regulator protein-glutamate methylesterase [Sphingomonas sp. AP4-R1]QJU57451.1 chemotaxis response regulator protein-glutamate methylesterase [Sphingomonas sp. AP4-R1]
MIVRTVIVDDSPTMRRLIATMLRRDPDILVIGEADGVESARQLIRDLNPDVVTLDVEMPGMNGLDFLERIMRLRPMPVVMVSTLTAHGADVTLRALELGAVDYFPKPTGPIEDLLRTDDGSLASKVRDAARTCVQARARRRASTMPPQLNFNGNGFLIGIGASTGGVEALLEVLSGFPANCPPTVVVQHMPGTFTQQFANRLDQQCLPTVEIARQDAFLQPGHVYIAPGGERHLTLRSPERPFCSLREGETVSGHRPSVDMLFRSIAKIAGGRAVGVLLTGMGADGAAGLLEMRTSGCVTIAQDKSTSVVFGMPRIAIEMEAANHVVPLGRIAAKAIELCSA